MVGNTSQTAPEGRTRRSRRRRNVRGMEVPRTGCAQTMSASNSTPCSREKDDGAERYRQSLLATVDGQLDLARDRLMLVSRRDDDVEDRIEAIREARCELKIAELLLTEEVRR